MFSRGLLVVLLVLVCVQSFTSAQNGRGPARCCLTYQTTKIPLKAIAKYEVTERQCTKSAFVLTTNKGQEVCANPRDEWVQKLVKQIDQRMFTREN